MEKNFDNAFRGPALIEIRHVFAEQPDTPFVANQAIRHARRNLGNRLIRRQGEFELCLDAVAYETTQGPSTLRIGLDGNDARHDLVSSKLQAALIQPEIAAGRPFGDFEMA